MKRETAVEFISKGLFDILQEAENNNILEIGTQNFKRYIEMFEKQAKAMEKNQKIDFANWCRIHDNKYPNTVMTIQQLYDKYEQELGSELESANSSERKNTLSDYGVAGEDNSMEYKQTEHPKVFSEDGQELFFDEQEKILNQIADTYPKELQNTYNKIQIQYASDEAPENAIYDDEGIIWTPLKETAFLNSKLKSSINSPFEVRAEIVQLFIMTPFNDLRKRTLIKESLKAMLLIGGFYELYPSKTNIKKFIKKEPNKTIGFSQIVLEYRLATEYQDAFVINKVGISHDIFKEGMDNVVEFLITNIFRLNEKTSVERNLLLDKVITAMILAFLNGEGYLGFYNQNFDSEEVLKGWHRVLDINDKQVRLENIKGESALINVDDLPRRINIKLTAIHKPNLNVGDTVRVIDEECSEFGRMGIIKEIMVESDRKRFICTEIEIHNGSKRYGLFITPFSSLEKLNQTTESDSKDLRMKPFVQEKQPQPNTPELENNSEPSTPKIRLQTALDIFELQEWKMEAFGIRTPKEFEDYREQRKQLYEKCKIIEQAEREKLIREACAICKTAFREFKKTTITEVVNQVLNK